MMSNFPTWWSACQEPQFDGTADDGPMTRWGWIYPTWCDAMGRSESAAAYTDFNMLSQPEAAALAQVYFWNRIGGAYIKSGPDVSFIDWCWTSGGATKVVQTMLSCYPDGVVGPKTIAAINAVPVGTMIQDLYNWRRAYFDSLGFRSKYPGLYTRAAYMLSLSKALIAPKTNATMVAPVPEFGAVVV